MHGIIGNLTLKIVQGYILKGSPEEVQAAIEIITRDPFSEIFPAYVIRNKNGRNVAVYFCYDGDDRRIVDPAFSPLSRRRKIYF